MKIPITKIEKTRIKEVDYQNLTFGKFFSDHMLVADFSDGHWQDAKIVPFGPFEISPSMTAIHHGQSIFEGMKAFKSPDDAVLLFRPYENFKRMNLSAARMCMPPISEHIFMEGIKALVDLDRDWIPTEEGKSLYIRPVYFSFDTVIGVKPAENYRLIVFTSPCSAYYSVPLSVKIERHYSRAAQGGVGFAKAAGNYGGAMLPTKLANDEGFHQILWTDAANHEFIEESGSMNVMFVIGDTLVTPSLSDSKLAGVTRESIIHIARIWGMKVETRQVSVLELVEAAKNGELKEAFGTGTAANLAHIAKIGFEDELFTLPDLPSHSFTNRMSKYLMDLKTGKIADPFSWMVNLDAVD
jgi:branched-chain amino acid aminotransferase